MQTVTQLLTRCEDRLSLFGGLDVNTYGQPKLLAIFQSVYDTLFDKVWWKHLLVTEDFDIDPVEGFPTDYVSDWIKRFSDIRYIWIPNQVSPLPMMPMDVNPALITDRRIEPYNDPEKMFRIRPIDGTVTICTIQYRTKPDPFTMADEVNFDEELLILGTCAEFTLAEGVNATLVKMFATKYEDRLNQMLYLEKQMSRSLYPVTATGIMSWRDA